VLCIFVAANGLAHKTLSTGYVNRAYNFINQPAIGVPESIREAPEVLFVLPNLFLHCQACMELLNDKNVDR
jgi:hypothetical protein